MFLPIFSIALGAFFAFFGVRIYFFRRYDLISDYTPAKGERFAKTAGLIQLGFGILFVIGGSLGLYIQNDTYSFLSLFCLLGGYIAAMNLITAKK